MPAKVEFRIRLNGVSIPDLSVQPVSADRPDELQIAVRVEGIGWFVVEDGDLLEYRDETSWLLLPLEMRQACVDKGWNRATPQELIGILQFAGAID